jgi:hypothetical protein
MGPTLSESDYDHRANLSGATGFVEQRVESEQVDVAMTPDELAHVLLSDSNHFDHFAGRYQSSTPFFLLADALRAAKSETTSISANLFYAVYLVR